jgi:surface polysaccharide O-acyltransferase-like enzyme
VFLLKITFNFTRLVFELELVNKFSGVLVTYKDFAAVCVRCICGSVVLTYFRKNLDIGMQTTTLKFSDIIIHVADTNRVLLRVVEDASDLRSVDDVSSLPDSRVTLNDVIERLE